MLRLETSGSSAATAFAEMQAHQKRRRPDQVCTEPAMLHLALEGAQPSSAWYCLSTSYSPKSFVRQRGA